MFGFRGQILRSSGRLITAMALFFIVGGHWGAMQAVAWTKMFWEYSQKDGSLAVGAKKTFDGEHPCRMCESIKEAKGKEDRSPALGASIKKLELFSLEGGDPLPKRVCADFQFPAAEDFFAVARGSSPPEPVPIV